MYNPVTNAIIFQSSVLRARALGKVGIRIRHDDLSSNSFSFSESPNFVASEFEGSRFSSISGDSVFSDMVTCFVEK